VGTGGELTLTWKLHQPSAQAELDSAAAGAAAQSAFRSIEDLTTSSLRFQRGPNSTTPLSSSYPSTNDGEFGIYFSSTTTTNFGNISGALAVSPKTFSTDGTILGSDILFNGAQFDWSTNGAAGTMDMEPTLLHETLHSLGAQHSPCYGSVVWPSTTNLNLLQSRCRAPDDEAFLSKTYPQTGAATGSINGKVLLDGGAVQRAIVVAIDTSGIPRATSVTNSSGAYGLAGLPPGSYTVATHHNVNFTFQATASGDVDWTGATPFLSASNASGITVSAGGIVTATTLAATAGTPSMKLKYLGLNGQTPQDQVGYLSQGANVPIRLVGSLPAAASVSSMNLGPGITISSGPANGPTVVGNPSLDYVVTVSPTATPGPRVLTLTKSGGERLLLPGYFVITGTGSLAVSTGPANPGASPVGASATNVPMLQITLSGGSEELRIRSISFSSTGTGNETSLAGVKLWHDTNGNGIVETNVDRRILTSGAYSANPPGEILGFSQNNGTIAFSNLAEPLLPGQTVRWLLTFDYPSSGSAGTFQATLDPSSLVIHGMSWGDAVTPIGSAVTGGVMSYNPALPALSSLAQFRTDGSTPILGGSYTDQTAVQLRGTINAPAGTSAKMQVEVRALGTAFTGTPTAESSSATPGTSVTLTSGSLTNGVGYHWQARVVPATGASGAWASFGSNGESDVDFSMDTSTTTLVSLGQFSSSGDAVQIGGSVPVGPVVLSGTGANSLGLSVRLEVEAKSLTTPFESTATVTGTLGESGSVIQAGFNQSTGKFHWQARAVNKLGKPSAWSPFGGNAESAADFELLQTSSPVAGNSQGGEHIEGEDPAHTCLGRIVSAPRSQNPWIFILLLFATTLWGIGRRGRHVA